MKFIIMEELKHFESIFEQITQNLTFFFLELLRPALLSQIRINLILQLLNNLIRNLDQLNDNLFLGLLHIVQIGIIVYDQTVDDELVLLLIDIESVDDTGSASQQVVVYFQLLVFDELDAAPVEVAGARLQFGQRLDE
jgi:hypothetical protein